MKQVVAALAFVAGMSGAALAQAPDPAAPLPPGTMATSHETHAVDAYGNRTDSASTSYRSDNGGAQETQSTTTRVIAPPPPPPPVTTSTTTTRSTTTTDPN